MIMPTRVALAGVALAGVELAGSELAGVELAGDRGRASGTAAVADMATVTIKTADAAGTRSRMCPRFLFARRVGQSPGQTCGQLDQPAAPCGWRCVKARWVVRRHVSEDVSVLAARWVVCRHVSEDVSVLAVRWVVSRHVWEDVPVLAARWVVCRHVWEDVPLVSARRAGPAV